MTLDEFIGLIQTIDPKAQRYDAAGEPGETFTVYRDYMETALYANNRPVESIDHVQVDYITNMEDDPTAQRYLDAFSQSDEVFFSYDKDFDTTNRTIRHIFDCQLI